MPLPDLGLAHRLADGGMNIFRMPLSELELGYGEPQLVRRLPASQGWRYDRSVTMTGDFGDLTAGDDGTADHVIWHATADGSIKVWAIGGGSDTTPRLWHTLPRRNGWNWADSRPMVGDVTGDGWDDVIVRHKAASNRANVFVLPSDGERLGPPELWFSENTAFSGFDGQRSLFGAPISWSLGTNWSINPDGRDAWWVIRQEYSFGQGDTRYPNGIGIHGRLSTGAGFDTGIDDVGHHFWYLSDPGWSYSSSRQVLGYVTDYYDPDLVSIVRLGTGGMRIWLHSAENGSTTQWQDLPTGGWSFANSRQHMADTNGDFLEDLISVHRTGTGGLIVWRHVSDGTSFAAPELVADLRTGGWNWSVSREGVADTWGVFVE